MNLVTNKTGSIDVKRIIQKLKEIEDNLELIRQSLPADVEEFKALKLLKDGIYKRLEFSIQNLIDIFSMIHSFLNLGIPSDLDDIFVKLRGKKVFSGEILSLVEDMKGLRNILIHRYAEIDDDVVFELLTEKIDDFEKIMVVLERYIEKIDFGHKSGRKYIKA
ncbi:MAG: DUF86 domain-containing protein [Nanoarchaeota archaeon]